MKKIIVLLTVLLLSMQLSAQRVYDTTTTNLIDEMMKIQAMLNENPQHPQAINVIYVTFFLEDVDDVTVRDTLSTQYTSYKDNFSFTNGDGSLWVVQNEKCQVTVHPSDSIVIVQKPASSEKIVLQVDVMDSLFQQLAMNSISATDSGIYRKISIHFDSDAPYNYYHIVYNTSNYRIIYIAYSLKKDLEIESSRQTNMYITFTDYTYINMDPNTTYFSTDPYIKILSSNDIRTSTNTVGYQIINMLNE